MSNGTCSRLASFEISSCCARFPILNQCVWINKVHKADFPIWVKTTAFVEKVQPRCVTEGDGERLGFRSLKFM